MLKMNAQNIKEVCISKNDHSPLSGIILITNLVGTLTKKTSTNFPKYK